jgi:hypothetical protein
MKATCCICSHTVKLKEARKWLCFELGRMVCPECQEDIVFANRDAVGN